MFASTGRLIPLHACSGPDNMAADQALLESVDEQACPVLRFYSWRLPTLSLGYFQQLADRALHAASTELECVRRATGGGAIIHHHELTYSLAVPCESAAAGPRLDLYRTTHQCVADTLLDYGVRTAPSRTLASAEFDQSPERFLCFQRRTGEDLIVGGYKILGSAQRKSRASVLQHGSLLLRASRWAPELPGIEELTSRVISSEDFAESLAERLGRAWSIHWDRGELSAQECQRAEAIAREKFANERWLYRR